MKKQLIVINKDTGDRLEEVEFSGGYNIVFTNQHDGGNLRYIRKLDNGKFGDKHWIKNFIYRPIAKRLIEKFPELKHIKPMGILFIEDMEWEMPDSAKPKRHWMARISKANKHLDFMTGYDYVLETRNYFIDRMSREQLVALIYHELRHIDKYGDLVSHDVEDWDNLVATLGRDWATTQAQIIDILEDDFEGWRELGKVATQLNMFDKLRAVK